MAWRSLLAGWVVARVGSPHRAEAAPAASALKVEHRHGQVVLMWAESNREAAARYVVRASAQPITAENAGAASVLAQLPPSSANDWWLNPETYVAPLETDPRTGKKPEVPHRGFAYDEPVDEAGRYEVVIRWEGDAARLPVTVDVTPRRRQRFRPAPGTVCTAVAIELATNQELQRLSATVEPNGLLSLRQVRLTAAPGTRLTVIAAK